MPGHRQQRKERHPRPRRDIEREVARRGEHHVLRADQDAAPVGLRSENATSPPADGRAGRQETPSPRTSGAATCCAGPCRNRCCPAPRSCAARDRRRTRQASSALTNPCRRSPPAASGPGSSAGPRPHRPPPAPARAQRERKVVCIHAPGAEQRHRHVRSHDRLTHVAPQTCRGSLTVVMLDGKGCGNPTPRVRKKPCPKRPRP